MLTKVELEDFQNKLLDRRVQIEKNLTGTTLELEGMRDLELNDEGDYAAASAETIVDSAILVPTPQKYTILLSSYFLFERIQSKAPSNYANAVFSSTECSRD